LGWGNGEKAGRQDVLQVTPIWEMAFYELERRSLHPNSQLAAKAVDHDRLLHRFFPSTVNDICCV